MLDKDSEYLKDESRQQGDAEEIYFVKNMSDVAAVLMGDQSMFSLTAQGNRTGISGAAVPVHGKIINFCRMSGIIAQGEDEHGVYMDVLPGTTLEEIQHSAPDNYFFPSEPTEETATIGGMFSTNAAGPSAGYYGTTGDYVLEADVFFPRFGFLKIVRGRYVFDDDGELEIEGNRLIVPDMRKKAVIRQLTPCPGMDLLDLLAGSEGMLGVFGRLRLRLVKQPGEKWKFLFFFNKELEALKFAEEIYENSVRWNCVYLTIDDFINKNSIQLYRKYADNVTSYARIPDIPENTCSVMIEIISERSEWIEPVLDELLMIFEDHGGTDDYSWAGDSPDEYLKIKKFRHAVPECINNELIIPGLPDAIKLSVDVLVNHQTIWNYLREIYDITDGSSAVTIHIPRKIYHIDPLFYNEEMFIKASLQREMLWKSAVSNGGILVAENGIGKGKMPQLDAFIPDSQKLIMNLVKDFFDGDGILNPGNMIFGNY